MIQDKLLNSPKDKTDGIVHPKGVNMGILGLAQWGCCTAFPTARLHIPRQQQKAMLQVPSPALTAEPLGAHFLQEKAFPSPYPLISLPQAAEGNKPNAVVGSTSL